MNKQLLITKEMVSIVDEVSDSASLKSTFLVSFNLDLVSIKYPSGSIFPKLDTFLISRIVKSLCKFRECHNDREKGVQSLPQWLRPVVKHKTNQRCFEALEVGHCSLQISFIHSLLELTGQSDKVSSNENLEREFSKGGVYGVDLVHIYLWDGRIHESFQAVLDLGLKRLEKLLNISLS